MSLTEDLPVYNSSGRELIQSAIPADSLNPEFPGVRIVESPGAQLLIQLYVLTWYELICFLLSSLHLITWL